MSTASALRRRRPIAVAALALTTLLALALWASVLGIVGSALVASPGAAHTTGHVVACGSEPLGPGCTVRFTRPDGSPASRTIDRPGLIGVAEGDLVPLLLDDAGRVTVTGWRAWADAAIALALAVFVSGGAVRWFAMVLSLGDAPTLFDLGEPGARDDRRWRAG